MRKRTPPQKRIGQSKSRFNIGVWGRQSGKTTHGLDKCLVSPLQGRDDGVYWYILQTYAAAKIAFNRYWKPLKNTPLLKDKSETERFIMLSNGASLFFKSGKNFEDLRAETLDGVVIDEFRQQDPSLWPEIIRPMLARRKGWADILTTPNGFDHGYDLYNFAKDHPEEWTTFHAPSTEAYWWSSEEIQSARSLMSEDEFAQEILAEFREFGSGKVYKNHGVYNQAFENPFASMGETWSPYLPIVVGLDFNVGLMPWELMQVRAADFYIGDEVSVRNTDTEQNAIVLADRVQGHKPGVILIGDSSGNARKTSAVGKTDYTIIKQVLKDRGIKFEDKTPSDNPAVKDRINCMNGRLKAADGSIHLWYHPVRCKELKKDFEKVKWKDGATGAIIDKTSDFERSHASDAAGYPVAHYSALMKNFVGTLQVIPR